MSNIQVLNNAIGVSISDSTFTNIGRDSITIIQQVSNALEKLDYVPSAGINAQNSEGCMEGTRTQILDDLRAWSRDPNAPRVFWLNGMAGTGKSAIARSFCHSLDRENLLGGSFFCSRAGSANQGDVTCILPTLARFLARRDGEYQQALVALLQEDPDAAHANLKLQVEQLLRKPLRSAFQGNKPSTLVLVIDALDECADTKATELLLTELVSAAPSLPIKFFVTSRPERHIRARFESTQADIHRILRLHDVEEDLVEADIYHYLTKRLQMVRDESGSLVMFPPEWPSHEDVTTATRQAGKLFIYAFTTVEYVRGEDPVERLQRLTNFAATAGQPLTKPLDDIYSFILSESLDPEKRERDEICMMKQILTVILTIREPLSVSTFSDLMRIPAHLFRARLDRLHAVVYVPPQDGSGIVATFHASFGDFLTTPGRAPDEMLLNLSDGHHVLVNTCIDVMASDALHFNISECSSSYLSNSEQKLVAIPAHLIYSCLNWPHHLVAIPNPSSVLSPLEAALSQKFLFWIEVLSALGKTSLASSLIMKTLSAESMINSMTHSLITFLQDANDFILSCQEVIRLSIPHIYLSALPSCHPTSRIAKEFQPKFMNTPKHVVHGIERQWRLLLHIQESVGVNSLMISPDGNYIVSGSPDQTVQVWDAKTGEAAMKPLQGHTGMVYSVAFSHDGSYIASGSKDSTIRIWDAKTGNPKMEPFTGHIGRIQSVAFSPDGSHVASASTDKTVRIWNVKTGKTVMQIGGHSSSVWAIAFSPNGTCLASGSADGVVQVWDPKTGKALLRPLKGHTGMIQCVGFSPNGSSIISASADKTIQLWDAKTGQQIMKPLQGHRDSIWSVAFSPDGTKIVSGSDDRTIRVWDARSGEAIMKPLEGHKSFVRSVMFWPDGSRIVSGSLDGTILVWDTKIGEVAMKPLEGHRKPVHSVAFSPDGTSVISGSSDKTIQMWGAKTGEALIEPLEGHTHSVLCVAFSSDGIHIVSGSSDKTIQIWDVETGKAFTKPLKGHRGPVHSIVISSDGSYIFSGSQDKTIRIWDARTGKTLMKPLEGHKGSVQAIALSPDGSHIISGSLDKTIRIWDTKTGKEVREPLVGHEGSICSVAFSPDGANIASGSDDKKIQVWKVHTGEVVMRLEKHKGAVCSIAFSADGAYIASGSKDKTIFIWDAKTGGVVIGPLEGHKDTVYSVAFSPDQSCIVSGSYDNTIHIWNLEAAKKTTELLATIASAQPSYFPQPIFSLGGNSLPDQQGWVRGPQKELILWIPPEYHLPGGLLLNTLIIGQVNASINLGQFVYGLDWIKCHTP